MKRFIDIVIAVMALILLSPIFIVVLFKVRRNLGSPVFFYQERPGQDAKIIKMIARDEALHLTGTQHILNLMRSGEDDPEMAEIAVECQQQCYDLFVLAAQQEKEWAEYLFRDGSMIGLNKEILCQYVEYITNIRMQAVGLGVPFATRTNPIPWINSWLVSDNVQVAPQEVEVSSYLVGQIDSEVSADDLSDFEL